GHGHGRLRLRIKRRAAAVVEGQRQIARAVDRGAARIGETALIRNAGGLNDHARIRRSQRNQQQGDGEKQSTHESVHRFLPTADRIQKNGECEMKVWANRAHGVAGNPGRTACGAAPPPPPPPPPAAAAMPPTNTAPPITYQRVFEDFFFSLVSVAAPGTTVDAGVGEGFAVVAAAAGATRGGAALLVSAGGAGGGGGARAPPGRARSGVLH